MADNKSCEDNKRSIGELTIDLDAENALKGLKAIQREARKATVELKKLEEQQNKTSGELDIKNILFEGDQETIVESIVKHNMGSEQLAKVAMLSSFLYDDGIDVAGVLRKVQAVYNVGTEDTELSSGSKHFFRFLRDTEVPLYE